MNRITDPRLAAGAILATLALLAACNSQDKAQVDSGKPAAPASAAASAPAPRQVYAQVIAVDEIKSQGSPSGAGAVVGGLLGAAVGNQVGSGNGRTAATVAGAVGGAVIGNNVEKQRSREVVGYRVTVRLDSGETRVFETRTLDGMQVGERVRIAGGQLLPG